MSTTQFGESKKERDNKTRRDEKNKIEKRTGLF